MKRTLWNVAVLAAVLALPTVASATNGYFSHGYGTEYKAMAGAGVALPMGALAGATNPAAIAFVGRRMDVGFAMFNPNRGYNVVGAPSGYPGTFGLAPGEVTSRSTFFPVPSAAISRPLMGGQAVALMLYANGGMNTNYDARTFGNTPTGVDLSQLFVAPTYARQIAEQHALGATAVLGYQRFSARGLGAFAAMSSDPAKLSDQGYANALGAGVRVGYQGRVMPWMSVGAAYQSRVWMTKFGSYAGLFCEGGDFDIPSNWTAGLAVTPLRGMALAADVQRTNYSEVRSVGHPISHLMMAPLGETGSAGFGWRDITTFKLGAQVQTSDTWTWRGGYSFGDQPIRSSEVLFNILAPGVIEQHASLGFTRQLGFGRSTSVALTHAFSHKVTGPNVLEAPGQQSIELRMDEWELEVGYSWGAR